MRPQNGPTPLPKSLNLEVPSRVCITYDLPHILVYGPPFMPRVLPGVQLELINPKRGFVGEASFTELNKKRQAEKTLHLFLFTDCLLISEPLKGATSKIQQATRAGMAYTLPSLSVFTLTFRSNLATNARASIRFNEPLYAFKQYFLLHEVIFKDIADSSCIALPPPCIIDTNTAVLMLSVS